MQRGDLVADDLVVAMVCERIGCLRCHGGFLLDGFPRTRAQAEALNVMLTAQGLTLDAVISYELPLEEIVARLSGRRICSNCKAVYHVLTQPPRAEGVCDQCGGALMQRDDDRPASIGIRMQAYAESNQPLADYYAHAGKLLNVRASSSPKEILRHSLQALNEHILKVDVCS
jgi:adenylate kinase